MSHLIISIFLSYYKIYLYALRSMGVDRAEAFNEIRERPERGSGAYFASAVASAAQSTTEIS
jgi:hypothetical protein